MTARQKGGGNQELILEKNAELKERIKMKELGRKELGRGHQQY